MNNRLTANNNVAANLVNTIFGGGKSLVFSQLVI